MGGLFNGLTGLLFVQPAEAAGAAGGAQGGLMGMMLPLAMFAAIFYFLIMRPQKKKQKAHDEMLASISRGSTVITAGGFFGVVREILDDSYIIELGDGVKARILKSSISVKRDEGADLKPKKKKSKKSQSEEATETASEVAEEQSAPETAPEAAEPVQTEPAADAAAPAAEAPAAPEAEKADKKEEA